MFRPAIQSIKAAEINLKLTQLFQKRASLAREQFQERTQRAFDTHLGPLLKDPMAAWDLWSGYYTYAIDCAQRSILFWDTMRQRGNNYLEHERAGKPAVLHFDYETVMDARTFKRPVNYSLLRIIPPKGVKVDPKRRPYIIIDPRAGHGPGIGGFKDDSQIGIALRDGHPVYFVTFFPYPEPGQTLADVTDAEQHFVHKIRQLHPDSPKPVLIGNCQGGWAAMMVAASDPKETGPIVINGAPMSYWGGAWSQGEGDNPMRYAAGLLGGTWLASLTADVGNGIFDGAWLVTNFENLNPANTFWDKYYHLFANVDTEPPRFLEFERWWGGYFLMNRQEIEWITQNLFVGNKLWSGEVRSRSGQPFDLREIKSPIVLFASLGDNITPPQQAFNWVADVYGSTDEIKARGQVIVGLLHKDIGHLGIFVSGKVAKKEHKQIVSLLKSIEALPPGLYGMEIKEGKPTNGKVEYEVQLVEHRLEDVQARLNRFKRTDEQPFKAVVDIADFNQHAYDLFARPLIQAVANEGTARLLRMFHPLRIQHWAISNLNPWLAWLGPAAPLVKQQRRSVAEDAPARRLESLMSELVSASLDSYRVMRDAVSEVLFYQIYGNLFALSLAEHEEKPALPNGHISIESQAKFKEAALSSLTEGGYPAAVARAFALLARHGVPFTLEQLQLRKELAEKFAPLLPGITFEKQRQVRGMQELIVRYDPELALNTLPKLLAAPGDRARLRTLLQRVMEDKSVRSMKLTAEQQKKLRQIMALLAPKARWHALPRRGMKPATSRQLTLA